MFGPASDLFQTARLCVCLYESAAQRRALARDPEVRRFSCWPDAETPAFAAAVVAMKCRSLRDGNGWFNFAIVLKGGDYAGDHAVLIEGDRATLGIALLPAMRGRGLAQETIGGSMRWLGTHGVAQFGAEIDPANTPSLSAFERAGFRRVRLDRDAVGLFWRLEATSLDAS